MKMKRITVVALLVVVLLGSPLVRAEGESLDSVTLDAIRTNCVNAQVNIQRIQGADKPTRINRGYLYDTLLKLMVNLNSRIAQNKIDSPELLTITSEYEKQLKSFTSDYTSYDEGLSQLTSYDCQAHPAQFYTGLVEARQLRDSLNKAVISLDSLLDRYQEDVTSVKRIVEAEL